MDKLKTQMLITGVLTNIIPAGFAIGGVAFMVIDGRSFGPLAAA